MDNTMNDFVIYGDTDSAFINFEKIIDKYDIRKEWENLPENEKIEFIKKFAFLSTNILNNRIYEQLQKNCFNSIEKDFKIEFKPEKISKSSLFVKKKKYANLVVWNEGTYGENIIIKGLEIIRSDTPTFFRKSLMIILKDILKRKTEEEIIKKTKKLEKEALKLPIEEISGNIGINNIKKYIDMENFSFKKRAPYHLRGAANYMFILDKLKIKNNYPEIMEGDKAKVVYLKENQYGMEVLSYQIWPKELEDNNIFPDRNKMIEKFFLKKVKYLMNPVNKNFLLEKNDNFNLFFG